MSEMLEIAGPAEVQVRIAGEVYTLRGIDIDDMVEFERKVGAFATHAGTPRGARWLFWCCLRNGGHDISETDAGKLIGPGGLKRMDSVFAALLGMEQQPEDPQAAMRAALDAEGLDEATIERVLARIAAGGDAIEDGEPGNAPTGT
jgi:hypothetical protein